MNNLDPVNVAAALASVLFGPTLAAIIGPYAVILVASAVGAAWALGRRDPSARFGALVFVLRLQATALIVTVPLTELVAWGLGSDDPAWLLAPVALVVGGIGDDWPRIGRWAVAFAGRLFERRAGGDGGAA